ncbi:MAG: PAS domain S-box protein [Dehalococcoidales bacterium]|nr:PAS domain S-box protein [Dehalococcoidales bacterium]
MSTRVRLTEQNYRELFENASDAIWVQDMEGNIVDANKACEKLTGFSHRELLRKNVKEFITGEFLKLAREIRRKLLNGEELAKPYEQRLVRKDGTIRMMKMSTSLVMIDGKPIGFQHVARDVTEEKSLAEMLAKITNGSPIATFVINKEHKITHWNTAIESLSGIRSQKVLGTDRQWQAFYPEKRPTKADLIVDGASPQKIEAYYQGKYRRSNLIEGAYEAEDFFPHLDDSGKWLRFTASPIKNAEGEIIAAIETLQDITEEKQLQDNMRYYIQLITRTQEEERKRLARDLHDDVSSSLLLLLQRLDSLISTRRQKLSPQVLSEKLEDLRTQTVSALDYIRRYAQDLRPRILDDLGLIPALEWMAEDLEKNYSIKANVKVSGTERNLPAEVQLLLFRIAQEALSNIRKHAKASLAVIKLAFGHDTITMTVSDNGRGFQVPARIEDLASGGRLGIMGMAERVRLLSGTLEIKSELGKGTRVITRLPV